MRCGSCGAEKPAGQQMLAVLYWFVTRGGSALLAVIAVGIVAFLVARYG